MHSLLSEALLALFALFHRISKRNLHIVFIQQQMLRHAYYTPPCPMEVWQLRLNVSAARRARGSAVTGVALHFRWR